MSLPFNILHIPEVALEKVFSFLPYDTIAKNRIVCKKFNDIGGKVLSRGFVQLEKRHQAVYKRLKSLLPRRESERKTHPLARHCDIFQAIETRISMLSTTYFKYMETNLICFIPGKVLDELRRVLLLLETDYPPPRTHQFLQELRDLSSMAMEHFDEHILPGVRELRRTQRTFPDSEVPPRCPRPFLAHQIFSNELHKVKTQTKSHKSQIIHLVQHSGKLVQKLRKQELRLKAQSQKIQEQERKIQEQENTLADIKKHMDEWDQKYTDLTNELIRARDDILAKASKSSLLPEPIPTPKIFKSNIKSRMSSILPKNYLPISLEMDRKRKSNLLPEIPVKRNRSPNTSHNNNLNNSLKEEPPSIPEIIHFEDKIKAKSSESSATDLLFSKNDLSSLINNSIENLKNSLSNIKNINQTRKRKMPEDIDLK